MTDEATPGALGSNAELGPLPPPVVNWPTSMLLRDGGIVLAAQYWSADQMRAYAAQEVQAAREQMIADG